ncbi:MAG: hypothetical protein LAO08_07350 [Acidobacteriia bacterium]|nr:hypothetical protein [Terriglobia bacterium]
MKAHSIRAIAGTALLLGLFFAQAGRAQERGPSTPEERARAVKVSHNLESDPLAKDAKDQRTWVLDWIEKIPDIAVNVCFDFFGKVPDPPRGHSREIVMQMIISSAAFMVEHPDKVKDEQSIATAGLLGSLKAYEAILKQDSSARWPYLDKIVQMREQNKLDDYIGETRRKCAHEDDDQDPDTLHARLAPPPVWNSIR